MSTIASPRPSNPSTSLNSTPTTSRTSSPAPTRRANRSALRDYYNLQSQSTAASATASTANTLPLSPEPTPPHSELDASDFDAEAYIKSVLAGQGLEGVLRVEGGLINEIKGLDGERKALVYDNYSKLITATDTIRSMRRNMEPATPSTSMLGPSVEHIAEVAGGLAGEAKVREKRDRDGGEGGEEERAADMKRSQRSTVRWVVGTPRRLRGLLDDGRTGEAEKDWEEVKGLLEKWEGVAGVEDLRDECQRIIGRS